MLILTLALIFILILIGFSTAIVSKDTLKISFIDQKGNTLYDTILSNPRSSNNVATGNIYFQSINSGRNYSTYTLYLVSSVSVVIGIIIGQNHHHYNYHHHHYYYNCHH